VGVGVVAFRFKPATFFGVVEKFTPDIPFGVSFIKLAFLTENEFESCERSLVFESELPGVIVALRVFRRGRIFSLLTSWSTSISIVDRDGPLSSKLKTTTCGSWKTAKPG
jgi:hypothetical protein